MKETTEKSTVFTRGGGDFLHNLWASVVATVVLIVICCGIYPLAIWAIAQGIFPNQANGSLVKKDGAPAKLAPVEPGTTQPDAVGSTLIGQQFTQACYFHPRPSAANNSAGSSYSPTGGYDPTSSGGTNYGPLSDVLINGQTNTPTTAPTTAPATTEPAAAGPTTAPEVAAAPTTSPTTAPAVSVATTQPGETLAYDGVRLRTLHYAMDNGLSFKLYSVAPDGTRTEVPLATYIDPASGSLLDIALVDAFPHPAANPTTPEAGVVAGPFTKSDGSPVLIPADAVTASASGLDPHISPANAALQARRVADQRKITLKQVQDLIEQNTDGRDLGFLGDPGVNVLKLNLALDAKYPVPAAPTTAPTTASAK